MQRFKMWFNPPEGNVWDKLHRPAEQDEFTVTASTVPEIMGVGYSSAKRQFDLYTGQSIWIEQNSMAIDHGKHSEDKAIATFYEHFPDWIGIKPGVIFHAQYPSIPLAASLDNIAVHKTKFPTPVLNIECKCPFYNDKKLPMSMRDVSLKNIVQAQTQMECTGIEKTVLWYWNENEQIGWKVARNKEYGKQIVMAVLEFQKRVEQFKHYKEYIDHLDPNPYQYKRGEFNHWKAAVQGWRDSLYDHKSPKDMPKKMKFDHSKIRCWSPFTLEQGYDEELRRGGFYD